MTRLCSPSRARWRCWVLSVGAEERATRVMRELTLEWNRGWRRDDQTLSQLDAQVEEL
jgi:hypothetical protein